MPDTSPPTMVDQKLSLFTVSPRNKRNISNAGSMSVHRLRHWHNIDSTFRVRGLYWLSYFWSSGRYHPINQEQWHNPRGVGLVYGTVYGGYCRVNWKATILNTLLLTFSTKTILDMMLCVKLLNWMSNSAVKRVTNYLMKICISKVLWMGCWWQDFTKRKPDFATLCGCRTGCGNKWHLYI